MAKRRKTLPVDVRKLVLHEAGYRCSNPVCRTMLTLDIHHLVPISEDGSDTPDNLLALCPNCHSLHHRGEIPIESLRAWKMILLSLNEGYDRKAVDLLLVLSKAGTLWVSGDGVIQCAALVASGLVESRALGGLTADQPLPAYAISLTERGKLMVDAWKRGDQNSVVAAEPQERA